MHACKKRNGKCVNRISLQMHVSLCKQDAGCHIIRAWGCVPMPQFLFVTLQWPGMWQRTKHSASPGQCHHKAGWPHVVWISWCCSVKSAIKMPCTKLSVSHNVIFHAVKFGYHLLCPVWDLRAYLQNALHEHLIDCLRLCNKYFPFLLLLKFLRLLHKSVE